MSNTNQWVSDAADSDEGWLERLTDGDLTNYFHSDWHSSFSGTHYIEATLPETTNTLFLYYYTRSTGTGCPTNITVSASADGTNWVDNLATINEADMPRVASTAYLSKPLSFNASYKHFRFYVPNTNSGSNSWFCLAEANLYQPTTEQAEAMTLAHVPTYTLTAEQIARIDALDTELRSTTVNVTYELYESDGTTLVNNVVVVQNKNSEIAVPASLTASIYYDYVTEGSIGTSDCTIKVTRTLKSEVVYPITNLSDTKSYYIKTRNNARKELSVYEDNGTKYLAVCIKDGLNVSAKKFAIIKYEENNYLYSVDDEMFVTFSGSDNTKAALAQTVTGTSDRIGFTATSTPLYEIRVDEKSNKIFNGSNSSYYPYGLVFNDWGDDSSEWDDGNQFAFYVADDFDPTNALDALEEHFHPSDATIFNNVIAQLETINYGTGLGQYGLSGDYAGHETQAATIISGLKEQGYTADNLTVAQGMLDATNLNMPTTGFYRIKGKTSNKYLAAGLASNSKFNMTDATDATTVFYFDGTKLVNFYSGMANGMTAGAWAWVVGENASTVEFQDGLTNGGYGIKSADANFYDNGDNSASADRGGNLTIDASTNARYTSWQLEEVTTLPVTISAAKYATLYAPVALTIPTGVKAYTAVDDENYLTLTAIEGNVIPANTGVILAGEANTYNFTVTTGGSVSSNALTGTVAAIARPAGSYILATGGSGVGFYADGANTIPGFKAYLPSGSGSVKSFRFADADAIRNISSALNKSEVYDLQGRRVAQPAHGLYIVNGKKVVIK